MVTDVLRRTRLLASGCLLAGLAGMSPAFAQPAQNEAHPAGRPAPVARPAPGPRPGLPGGPHPGFAGGRPGFPGEGGRPGFAGGRPGFGGPRPGHFEFRGRDVRRFDGRDLAAWRGGRWAHEWHDGRFGWWWSVGDTWYFYPEPVYPYPEVVSDFSFADEELGGPPEAVAAPAPGLPPPQFWYWCDNPRGYYPYVQACPSAFRPVPAGPR